MTKKEFLVVPIGFTQRRQLFTRVFKGQQDRRDIVKWCITARPAVALYLNILKRITKLKCVNSEFQSVDIDPSWGCLNWPYGTMSESP